MLPEGDERILGENRGLIGCIQSKDNCLSVFVKRYNWNRVLVIYSLILMAVILVTRCFNNNFWCDECYTILLSYEDFIPMIERESWDMHPPLYHIIFFIFCKLFGSTPFIYHFVSYVPYAIAIILTITVLRKEYGTGFSLMMVTFISVLLSSLNFVQDARMYEWGMLFVLCAFISAISLMKRNRTKDYVFLVISVDLCAYTHYYCLLSVAVIFLYLIVWSIRTKDRSTMKKMLISAVASVLIYLPWIFNFVSIFFREAINGSTSTTIYLPIARCITWLFEGNGVVIFFIAILVSLIVYIVYKCSFISFKPETEKKLDGFVSFFNLDEADWKGIALGMIVIFVTILLPTVFTYIVQPIVELRYLFPVSAIAWFIVAMCASKCKVKTIATVVVLSITLLFAVPLGTMMIIEDYHTDETIEKTLDLTKPYMTENDMILANEHALVWTVFDYYYPGVESQQLTTDYLPELDVSRQYWLFLSSSMSENLKEDIYAKGYDYSTIIEKGNIGSYDVWVYELII